MMTRKEFNEIQKELNDKLESVADVMSEEELVKAKKTMDEMVEKKIKAIAAPKVPKKKKATRKQSRYTSTTLKLITPIFIGDDTSIEEITFQVPKAKHLRFLQLDNPKMDDLLTLAGKLCALPPSTIDELSVHDVFKVIQVIFGFLGDGVVTGKTA